MKALSIVAIICFVLMPLHSRSQSPVILGVNIVGAEARPLRNTYVKIISKDFKQEIIRDDGRFIVHLPDTGLYRFWAGGVHHKSLTFPLLIEARENSIDIEIQLAAAPLEEKLDSVFIIGDFNKFSAQAGRITMYRLKNGKFTATVPAASDTLAYQLIGVQFGWRSPLEGTQAHHYAYLPQQRETPFGSTKFSSVVKTKGRTSEIVFDPGRLPVSNSLPRVEFNKPDSRAARIASVALDASRRDELIYHAHVHNVRRGGHVDEKYYDKSQDQAEYTKLILEEKDLFVRQYLLLCYFAFIAEEATPEMAELFLEAVPPSSAVWRLRPNVYPFKWVSKALNYSKETEEYVYHVVTSQHHPVLLSSFLSFGLETAFLAGNQMLVDLYYNRLVNEFPDSHYAAWAVKTYGPDYKFSKGKPVPFFETKDLEDSTLIYTTESLKGKVYLMDFWATWCGPCVEALPDLQKIYDSFKDKGFTILSISADEHAEKIHAFRKKRWAMPWMHTMLRNGLEDPLAVAYEVIDLPKAILVDEHGIILASHADLKKEGLQAILDRHFGIAK